MKSASVKEIKSELQHLENEALMSMLLRLARYKKDNKELLTYLLFEAHNEADFIEGVKHEVGQLFDELPTGNVYYIKKSLRKILRIVNRQVKYSGIPQTEIELRIFICDKMNENKIPMKEGTVLFNLYNQQVKKIRSLLKKIPEDHEEDFRAGLNRL